MGRAFEIDVRLQRKPILKYGRAFFFFIRGKEMFSDYSLKIVGSEIRGILFSEGTKAY